jgi:hypothetical protein
MFDQNLLTIFIGLTTLSILIQTGIIAGLLYVTVKMSRQTDRAMTQSRRMFDPLHRIIDTLQTGSARVDRALDRRRQHTA